MISYYLALNLKLLTPLTSVEAEDTAVMLTEAERKAGYHVVCELDADEYRCQQVQTLATYKQEQTLAEFDLALAQSFAG